MKKERTYVMIKVDGVQRSLVGEIIGRFERAGLKIVGIKMFTPDRARATEHYGKDDAWYERKGQIMIENLKAAGKPVEKEAIEYGRDIIKVVLDYIVAGPAVGFVLEGHQAVAIAKKLVGGTEPLTADVGTIRSDFTLDSYQMANADSRSVRNLIHCSGEIDEAEKEIKIWFNDNELVNYRHINEAMLYDVNMDGILE